MEDAVGPILCMSDGVDLVVQAILDDNPDREVEVVDRGSYVRVQARGSLRLTRASLQRQLGSSFQMRQFEAMLSSFAGRIQTATDEITWTLSIEAERAGTQPQQERLA
ncbi:MAG TPA: MmoB/DmpM family protein [Polyangiaceae bacterium]|nr:MmoB/DmpM family protein [Polyangiaceae bacterium]